MNIKNIFLITIDCLRADFIYEMDKHKVYAPHTKKILENSLWFPHAITNGPGTRFAFPALMMSKLPGEIEGIGLPANEGKTIAEFFREKGYVTIGISTNGWISRDFNYHRGFDFFYDPINWGRKEDKIKRKVVKFLKNKNILFRIARKGKDIISKLKKTFAFSYKFAEEVNKKLFTIIRENNLYDKKKIYLDPLYGCSSSLLY